MFSVLATFLGDDSTPFQSGDEMMEPRDKEELAVCTLRQCEKILALRQFRTNLTPRVRTKINLRTRTQVRNIIAQERRHAEARAYAIISISAARLNRQHTITSAKFRFLIESKHRSQQFP